MRSCTEVRSVVPANWSSASCRPVVMAVWRRVCRGRAPMKTSLVAGASAAAVIRSVAVSDASSRTRWDGGELPADDAGIAYFSRGTIGSAGTCQPRPPRAAHRPPRAPPRPRTTLGCTCGHGSAPPTAPRPHAYAGGGPWRRISAFGSPMTGRRPRMTRARPRPPEGLCECPPVSRSPRKGPLHRSKIYNTINAGFCSFFATPNTG